MKTDGGTKIRIQNIDKYMQEEEILADPQNSNWSKAIEDTCLYKEQTNEPESLKQILKNKYVGLESSGGDPIGNSKVKQIEKDVDDAKRELYECFSICIWLEIKIVMVKLSSRWSRGKSLKSKGLFPLWSQVQVMWLLILMVTRGLHGR